MPIRIKDGDSGIGNIVESRGRVTDQDLVDSLRQHLTQDKAKFKKYKYMLIDHTELTTVDISDETVESIAGLCAEISRINPDTIVAMVNNAPIGANIDLINRLSKMSELFIYQSCWESRIFRTKPSAVRWIREKVKEKFDIDNLTFG